MRNIDRLLQADNPKYDLQLSRLLLPVLEPGAHIPRSIKEKAEAADSPLTSLVNWDSARMPLPVGTCLLSPSYRWPFDVRDSKESVAWAVMRLNEASSLASLDRDHAFARFLYQEGPRFESSSSSVNTRFGPFNDIGIILNLRSCRALPRELLQLAVSRRSKWLQFILRECGPLPTMYFPPMSHVLGVMVDHPEFTDEVAMDMYGAFDNCTIAIMTESDLMPAFGLATSVQCNALGTVSNGNAKLTLAALNGATILFLGCLLLQEENAVHKLLNMKVISLVILKDMSDHGLGWLVQPRDAGSIISRWLEKTTCNPRAPPATPQLSLFLTAWINRRGGPMHHGSNAPIDLFSDTGSLDPLQLLHGRIAEDTTDMSANELSRLGNIAHGGFRGCCTGSAAALFLDASEGPEMEGVRADAPAQRWVEVLLRAALQNGGPNLMTPEAAEATKTYLNSKLGHCPAAASKKLQELDEGIRKQIARFKHDLDREELALFMHHFYRAFFVALTQGRIHDDGVSPLTWVKMPLRVEVGEARLKLLRLPSSAHEHLIEKPERPSLRLHRLFVGAFLLVVVAILTVPGSLWQQDGRTATDLALGSSTRVGLGRLRSSSWASPEWLVNENQDVYTLSTAVGDWQKIEGFDGRTGVSEPDQC